MDVYLCLTNATAGIPRRMMSKKVVITLSVVVIVLLLVANVGFWLERQVFNEDRFAETAVEAIKTQRVRGAIASEIIAKTLGDLPELQKLANEFIKPTLRDFLDSDVIVPAMEEIAGQIQVALTSSEPTAIAINISGLTQPAKVAADLIPNLDPEVKTTVQKLPNSIELLEKGAIPSIFTLGITIVWVGRIAAVAALAMIIGLAWSAIVNKRSYILKTTGYSVSIGAMIFLVLIWTFKSPLLATVGSGNVRIIVGDLYGAFVDLLVQQTWIVFAGGLVIIGSSYLLDYWLNRQSGAKPSSIVSLLRRSGEKQ